jgi:NADH:ubiquinone oxidoreductase subunit K
MITNVPMEHGLFLAATLFVLGLVGARAQEHVHACPEVMLNAGSGLAVAGARWDKLTAR